MTREEIKKMPIRTLSNKVSELVENHTGAKIKDRGALTFKGKAYVLRVARIKSKSLAAFKKTRFNFWHCNQVHTVLINRNILIAMVFDNGRIYLASLPPFSTKDYTKQKEYFYQTDYDLSKEATIIGELKGVEHGRIRMNEGIKCPCCGQTIRKR